MKEGKLGSLSRYTQHVEESTRGTPPTLGWWWGLGRGLGGAGGGMWRYGGGPFAIHTCLPGRAWTERLPGIDTLAWRKTDREDVT